MTKENLQSAAPHFPECWVDRFASSLDGITSPQLFRTWGGIVAVAGALERKVWVFTNGSNLYPNLYATLVAPPAVGKTEVIWRVGELWRGLDDHHVAGASLTKAALVDQLNEGERKIFNPKMTPQSLSFNSLLVASDELGVLLPAYDREMLNFLTHVYDGKSYSEQRRSTKLLIDMPYTNLNLFAGTTPGFLVDTLPPGAWDQGLMSRMIMIYSEEKILTSLFNRKTIEMKAVAEELNEIGRIAGQCEFTKEAAEFIDHWYLTGQSPVPTHPRLYYYCGRRITSVLKLSMIAAISSTHSRRIEQVHIQMALDWLIQAEFNMPDLFKSMSSGGDKPVIEDTFHYLYHFYIKKKNPVPEAVLVNFLYERVPSYQIERIILTMEQAGLIKKQLMEGGVCYVPKQPNP